MQGIEILSVPANQEQRSDADAEAVDQFFMEFLQSCDQQILNNVHI
jgi:hypothetical protein